MRRISALLLLLASCGPHDAVLGTWWVRFPYDGDSPSLAEECVANGEAYVLRSGGASHSGIRVVHTASGLSALLANETFEVTHEDDHLRLVRDRRHTDGGEPAGVLQEMDIDLAGAEPHAGTWTFTSARCALTFDLEAGRL